VVTVNDDAPEQQPALPDDDDLVAAAKVKEEFGKISDMTLWRWLHSAKTPFPPPDFVINRLRYWKRRTLRQHRYRLELEKPHPVKSAASFVQSPRRQTRSTPPARMPQEEERHAREK
jgi:hypothetical protein